MGELERQLLLKMLHEHLFLALGSTVFIYFLAYYVAFRLCFKVLNVKISLKQITPSICIMTLYSLTAKQVLSLNWYTVVMIPLIIASLTFTEKIALKEFHVLTISNITKLSWTALLMLICNTIGFVLIVSPLSLDEKIGLFFSTTIAGYNTASLIETLFTAILLYVLIKFPKISLLPPIKDKITFIDIVALVTYIAMFSAVYSSSAKLWTGLTNPPRQVFGDFLYQWLMVLIVVSGHNMLVRNLKHKNGKLKEAARILENEKALLEREKTRMQAENIELLRQVEELASLNGETEVHQQLREIFNEYTHKIHHIVGSIPVQDNELIDKEQNILNILTGKTNQEIASILNLNECEMYLLHSIIHGRSDKDMAAKLLLGEDAVENLVIDLLAKFKLNDRTLLLPYILEFFVQINLIKPGDTADIA